MARYKKKLEDDIRCPLEYGLTIFGGKWKSRIICVLAVNEKLRYSELRREMCNISCMLRKWFISHLAYLYDTAEHCCFYFYQRYCFDHLYEQMHEGIPG